ncbi:MAG: hypothetical protein ACRDSX_06460 [Mycobacterium sp.]
MLRACAAPGCALALAFTATATSHADPPPGADVFDSYPIAHGHYTTTTDYLAIFFKTPDGHSCAIYPNGGPLGCDTVPSDAPAGTNQTVVNPGVVAEYRHSDAPSFARAVDALPKRYRLVNWGASCGIDDQGTVTCKTYGEHGFTISRAYGVLW